MSIGAGTESTVSIVVVCFDGSATLRDCIESLLTDEDPPIELFVVDNASTDHSADVIRDLASEHPLLRVVLCDENLGYSGAVNRVLPDCRGRYLAVLNMDLTVEPGWLAPLIEFLDAHDEVAAVNPMLALRDSERVNALGQDVHVTGLGFNRGLGSRLDEIGLEPFSVSGIQGAAFVVRRELLVEAGGMDAAGFLYHEDVNLSWLLRMMGHSLYCVPKSVVRHDYFLSMHAEKLFLLERNRLTMLLTHLRRISLLALLPMLLLTESMLWGFALMRGPSFLSSKARSYAWLWRTRRQRASRRQDIQALRVRGDVEVLRAMRWRYSWRQFAVLAGERGAARRRLDEHSPADTNALR